MADAFLYKGVTPTYTFTAPEQLDMTQATMIWVTFSTTPEEREILTKYGDELTITAHSVSVYLSQEETLRFPDGDIKAQLNWIYEQDGKTKRATSNKFIIRAENNLKNEVLNGD